MGLYLKRDVTFADGTIKKGTEIKPVREKDMIISLENSFSSIWAHRMRKDFIPCNVRGINRWMHKKDIA